MVLPYTTVYVWAVQCIDVGSSANAKGEDCGVSCGVSKLYVSTSCFVTTKSLASDIARSIIGYLHVQS